MVLWVEQLEDRTVPSTLIWNGAAGGNWDVAKNWLEEITVKGQIKFVPSKSAAADGDILEFGNPAAGKNTSAVDDIPDLEIGALHVFAGFGQDIQLAKSLTINPIEPGGNNLGLSFLFSGSISGENLTLGNGTLLSWRDAAQNGTGSSETIIERGASLLIKPTGRATLNERTLVVEAGAAVSFTSGSLRLDGEAGVINEGQFTVTGTAASITTAGNGALGFENKGNASLVVRVPFSMLTRFTHESSKAVNVTNGVLELGGGGTIAGAFVGLGSVEFSSAHYNWEKGAAFNAGVKASVEADAVVNLAKGIKVPFTPLAALIVNGGTIAGQGTIEIQKAATATLKNAILSGAKVENSGKIELTENGALQMAVGATITNKATFNIVGDSTILGDAASTIINNGTFQKTDGKGNSVIDVHVITTKPLNPPAKGKWEFTNLEQIKKKASLDVGGTQVVGLLHNEGGVDFGSGTVVGTFIANGQIDPGDTELPGGGFARLPGIISVDGTYSQRARGALNIDIAGPTPGTQFDRLVVTGTVALGGRLNVNALPGFTGNYFDILVNQSGHEINGRFDGLAEGAGLLLGGRQFFITYFGSTSGTRGNDVVLYAKHSVFTPTVTAVFSDNNPSLLGEPVTFTADVTVPSFGAPTGPVEFFDGNQPIGVGQLAVVNNLDLATFTTSSLTLGEHDITAEYLGDFNFSPSTSPVLIQTVGTATQTTIASSVNPSVTGQGVAFTATVTTASGQEVTTGTVEFFAAFPDGADVLLGTSSFTNAKPAITVNFLLPPGNEIFAIYLGSGEFLSSTSPLLDQVVNRADTFQTLSAASPTVVSGQPDNFSSTLNAVPPGSFVFPPSGTITFFVSFDGSAPMVLTEFTLVNGSGSASFPSFTTPGTYTIYDVYSGDNFYNGSTSPSVTITVVSSSGTAADPPNTLSLSSSLSDDSDALAFASYYLALQQQGG